MDRVWSEVSAEFLQILHVVETSWWTPRVVVFLAAAVVLFVSLWVAKRQRAEVLRGIPGRIPINTQDQVRRYHHRRLMTALKNAGRAAVVLVCGLLLPSAMFAAALYQYSWFRPGAEPLVATTGCGSISSHASLGGIASFLQAQLWLGLADVGPARTTLLSMSLISEKGLYAPADPIVGGAVVWFRSWIGLSFWVMIDLLLAALRQAVVPSKQEKNARKSVTDPDVRGALESHLGFRPV